MNENSYVVSRYLLAFVLVSSLAISNALAQSASESEAAKKAADNDSKEVGECLKASMLHLGVTAGSEVERDKELEVVRNCEKVADSESHSDYWRSTAFSHIGVSYYNLGEMNSAITNFNRAIELNRSNEPAYSARAEVYKKLGDTKKAVTDFESAVNCSETSLAKSVAYQKLAFIYNDKSDYDLAIVYQSKAIEVLEASLRSDPVSAKFESGAVANLYHNRGVLWANKGNSERAQADYAKAIDLKDNGH